MGKNFFDWLLGDVELVSFSRGDLKIEGYSKSNKHLSEEVDTTSVSYDSKLELFK